MRLKKCFESRIHFFFLPLQKKKRNENERFGQELQDRKLASSVSKPSKKNLSTNQYYAVISARVHKFAQNSFISGIAAVAISPTPKQN